MRRTLTIAALAVMIGAGSARAQTGLAVPVDHVQLYIPAVSAPLPPNASVLAPPVGERRPLVLPALYVGLVALQGADLYSTHAARTNGALELNPLLNTVGGGVAGQTAFKAALTTSSILLAERLWKKKKRVAAVVSMIAANSLMAVVVRQNMQHARVLLP